MGNSFPNDVFEPSNVQLSPPAELNRGVPELSNTQSAPPAEPNQADPSGSNTSPPNNGRHQISFKKTLFYDFLPIKAAKDTDSARNIPHRVTSQLIEIRDNLPLLQFPSHYQPTLSRVVEEDDVLMTKLTILPHEAYDYIFRYWSTSDVENVLAGRRHYVTIRDNTGCNDGGGSSSSSGNRVNEPCWYNDSSAYIMKCDNSDEYYLNLRDLYRSRQIRAGDSIKLPWDVTYGYIHLKVVPQET
ncbi:hypothetical protein ACJRO7_018013 [Eucalyptus globulus]|uniref:Uncharacterized protein n=1 Tax=Eucalyptus globulus TaxID=34317 RepID=A0ABD3KTV5_EUCGL